MVKNGFSEDVAFGICDEWRLAIVIKLMEFKGVSYDWDTNTFKKDAD